MADSTTRRGVTASYGVHSVMVDAVGKTVGEVRAGTQQVLSIPENGTYAVVNGRKVSDDHVIGEGEQVEFIKEAGVKG